MRPHADTLADVPVAVLVVVFAICPMVALAAAFGLWPHVEPPRVSGS